MVPGGRDRELGPMYRDIIEEKELKMLGRSGEDRSACFAQSSGH